MSRIGMVSVVIPTLNEAGTIGGTIKTIKESLRRPYEIIVVDGNSTDNTKEIVKKENCRLIVEPRRGYGTALKVGISHAKGDVIVMVDGDGTYDVKDINLLLDTLSKEGAELCMASRMNSLYDGSMDLLNFLGNRIITLVFNLLFRQNLTDTQSGFRAIRRSALDKVELKENDMAFATEMLVRFAKKGFKIIEVPTSYRPRVYGKSKLRRLRAGLEIFKVLIEGALQSENST
ncbi:MAG: glycosyltransferase family 2 protein [Nitrososphaerota archaeon]|nr:glycosyltransferase family 2 protein [Candidatus Bathyarchaeota archaeon]MDW8194162.1 glycosyltransferase family 2 protein [Nitrososphaerota archaeon]